MDEVVASAQQLGSVAQLVRIETAIPLLPEDLWLHFSQMFLLINVDVYNFQSKFPTSKKSLNKFLPGLGLTYGNSLVNSAVWLTRTLILYSSYF